MTHTYRTLAALLCAILLPTMLPTLLHAQRTGEWLVVDSTREGIVNSIPRMIVASAPGHYVLVAHENALVGPYTIRRTTDAGSSWQVVRADSGDDWRITGIAHPTPSTIVATGMRVVPVAPGSTLKSARSLVLRSSDGGVSWHETALPEGVRAEAIAMCDERHGAIVTYRWVETTRTDLAMLTTADGGATWTRHPIDSAGMTANRIHCRARGSYLLPAYDQRGREAIALHTADDGASWSRTPMPAIGDIDVVDSSTAYGVAGIATGVGDTRRDRLVRTTDGGATWTTLIDSLIDFRFGLQGVSFADRRNGIAVGGYGKILRTTDGGATWSREWPPSEKVAEYIDLHDVAFGAPTEALAISDDALVLRFAGRQRLSAPWITAPRENTAELPFDVTLAWTPVTGAQWYDVQIGDTIYAHNVVSHRIFDVPFLDVRWLASTSLAVHLAPRTRYVVRVRARNESDTSDWSVRLSTITRAEGRSLTTPRMLVPANGERSAPVPTRIEWTPIDGATAYDVLLCDNPNFIGPGVIEISDVPASSVTTPLPLGTELWVSVRARNAAESTAWSAFVSGRWSFTTAMVSGIEEEIAQRDRTIAVVPNPASERAEVVLTSARSGLVTLRLVDALGREHRVLSRRTIDAGITRVPLDLTGVPAGAYRVVVEGSEVRGAVGVVVR